MSIRNFLHTAAVTVLLTAALPAQAHFQMIIPSQDIVASPADRNVNINVLFWHPFEGHGMDMDMPVRFGVQQGDNKTDLLGTLKPNQFTGTDGKKHRGFKTAYALPKPGDYIFYVEPKPYWEPAEEHFLIHYTKVVVDGFGLEEGWDKEVGLKTEIVPLTRPYGLYAGDVFTGVVKVDGRPVPNARVEVEWYNETGKAKAPRDSHITQVVMTDANGVFTHAMTRPGWWGFAALTEGDKPIQKDGKDYPVEQGAIIWMKAYPVK